MKLIQEIPDRFWSLFRSVNRSAYIDALLKISEEYEYSNYFLSREMCIQLLSEHFAARRPVIWEDQLEPPATRVLNWLLKAGWLRKVDDYTTMTVNIIIPDYSAVMIESFSRLMSDGEDEAQVYIQNIYAILFSLKHDPRSGVSLLDTALVNTKKLNKSLQDMLHNMDKFFGKLLEQKDYASLLRDHLEGYVEEVVNKKYHILKTSDNFYLYKTDIKSWIASMREDLPWLTRLSGPGDTGEILAKLDQLERGFDDIEHRIANMDKEHSRYIKATVTRMGYLLNQEDDTKGLMIRLLNYLSRTGGTREELSAISGRMNLSLPNLISGDSLYKRRHTKTAFTEQLKDEEETPELSAEEILSLNKVKNRYSRQEIEAFISSRMKDGRMEVTADTVENDGDFQKLILAYDESTRKRSLYQVDDENAAPVTNGPYTYPGFVFVRRSRK